MPSCHVDERSATPVDGGRIRKRPGENRLEHNDIRILSVWTVMFGPDVSREVALRSNPNEYFTIPHGGDTRNDLGKAAALAYSRALNHPFVDGHKRVAHAAMEVFLALNGLELHANVHEHDTLFLNLASGRSAAPSWKPGWTDIR